MLNNLLLISLISLGAGALAPASLNNKSNLLANDQTTEFTLNINQSNYVTTTNTLGISRKYNYQQYNEALLVKGNIYTQNTQGSYNWVTFNAEQESGYNQMGYMIQITPYKYLYSSTITVKPTINIDWYSLLNQSNEYDLITYKVNVLTSKENWSNYIDSANYYSNAFVRSIYEDLTDTNNGYLYNHEYITRTINTENYYNSNEQVLNTEEFEIQIPIVNGITNYCYIYISFEMYNSEMPYPNNNTTNMDLQEFVLPNNNPYLSIDGLMIPPVTNYEIIDLPGTMFYVLTMPFTFISTAFNLTLFPGTLYQFNIGNIFLTIIGVLSFIFLIRIFTRNR